MYMYINIPSPPPITCPTHVHLYMYIPLDIIPRSILMVTFSGSHYLLCALGDGCLV
jgi:hypothetical protein